MGDLATSLCACLVADACTIGPGPLIRGDIPGLRRARLSWVSQNFIRNETLTEANACLVAEHNRIPLVHEWGGGEVASGRWVYGPSYRFAQFTLGPIPNISGMNAASHITTLFPTSSPG